MTKKAKEVEATEVATVDQFSQQSIPAMIAQVNAKIKQLSPAGSSDADAKMGDRKISGYGRLDDISTVENIVKVHSAMKEKNRAYTESAKTLGVDLKKYPIQIDGYSPKTWIKALENRLTRVKNKVELAKLMEAKKLLEANLSAEDKLAKDLAKIQGMFTE